MHEQQRDQQAPSATPEPYEAPKLDEVELDRGPRVVASGITGPTGV